MVESLPPLPTPVNQELCKTTIVVEIRRIRVTGPSACLLFGKLTHLQQYSYHLITKTARWKKQALDKTIEMLSENEPHTKFVRFITYYICSFNNRTEFFGELEGHETSGSAYETKSGV